MPGKPATLNANNKVVRMRFRLPQVPCDESVCAIDGSEQMRYWGLSYVDLNPDPEGYVTLIITFGTPLPAHVTAENGYSVVSLPVSDIRLVTLRNILPAADFACAIDNVPYNSNEHNASGGYMGEYVPFVDFPFVSLLPTAASPYVQPDSCQAVPPAAASAKAPTSRRRR